MVRWCGVVMVWCGVVEQQVGGAECCWQQFLTFILKVYFCDA